MQGPATVGGFNSSVDGQTVEALNARHAPMVLLGSKSTVVGSKTFTLAGGVVVSSSAFPKHYDLYQEVEISSFDDMAAALQRLLDMPKYHFVFGRLRDGADRSRIARASNRQKGDMVDAPTSVLMIDTETVLLDAVEDPRVDPEDALDTLRNMLVDAAPELDGARCVGTYSSSAGFSQVFKRGKGDALKAVDIDTVRAHLTYFLSKPLFPSEIAAWADRVNERMAALWPDRLKKRESGEPENFIDSGIYGAGKVVYTARAVTIGVADPLPGGKRQLILRGDVDEVTLDVPATGRSSRRGAPSRGGERRKACNEVGPFRWPVGYPRGGKIPTIHETREALSRVGNANLVWDKWNEIGMSLHALYGGSRVGLDLFNEFSAKSAKHDPAETEARWHHFSVSPATDFNGRHIFELAGMVHAYRDKQNDRATSADVDTAIEVMAGGKEINQGDPAYVWLQSVTGSAVAASRLASLVRGSSDGGVLLPHLNENATPVGVTELKLNVAGRVTGRVFHARCDLQPFRLPATVDAVAEFGSATVMAGSVEEGIAMWSASGLPMLAGTGKESPARFAMWAKPGERYFLAMPHVSRESRDRDGINSEYAKSTMRLRHLHKLAVMPLQVHPSDVEKKDDTTVADLLTRDGPSAVLARMRAAMPTAVSNNWVSTGGGDAERLGEMVRNEIQPLLKDFETGAKLFWLRRHGQIDVGGPYGMPGVIEADGFQNFTRGILSTVGTGKSFLIAQFIVNMIRYLRKRGDQSVIVYAAPRLDLCEQMESLLNGSGVRAFSRPGNGSHDHRVGHANCFHKDGATLKECGVSPKHYCTKDDRATNPVDPTQHCVWPDYDDVECDVLILTTASLFNPGPKQVKDATMKESRVKILIVDEDAGAHAIERERHFSPSEIAFVRGVSLDEAARALELALAPQPVVGVNHAADDGDDWHDYDGGDHDCYHDHDHDVYHDHDHGDDDHGGAYRDVSGSAAVEPARKSASALMQDNAEDEPERKWTKRKQEALLGYRGLVVKMVEHLGASVQVTSDHLRQFGISEELALEAAGLEKARKVWPSKKSGVKMSHLALNKDMSPFQFMWNAMADLFRREAEGDTGTSGWLETAEVEGVVGLTVRRRKFIHDDYRGVPTLLINGVLVNDIDELVFPGLRVYPHLMFDTPFAYTVQLLDSDVPNADTFHKSEVKSDDGEAGATPASDRAVAKAKLMREVALVSATVIGVRTRRDTLIGSNATAHALMDEALKDRAESAKAGPQINTAHYKATAGLNKWTGNNVIPLGGHRKPIRVIEDMVMSLTGVGFERQAEWTDYAGFRDVRSPLTGRMSLPCRQKSHPIMLVHIMRWLEAIGEMAQLLGRARDLREATEAMRLIKLVLDSTPVWGCVDAFVSLYNLRDIPAWARMLHLTGMILEERSHAVAALAKHGIELHDNAIVMDRLQWPLNDMMMPDGTVSSGLPGVPEALDVLASVTYRVAGARGVLNAYMLPTIADQAAKLIGEAVGAEVEVLEVTPPVAVDPRPKASADPEEGIHGDDAPGGLPRSDLGRLSRLDEVGVWPVLVDGNGRLVNAAVRVAASVAGLTFGAAKNLLKRDRLLAMQVTSKANAAVRAGVDLYEVIHRDASDPVRCAVTVTGLSYIEEMSAMDATLVAPEVLALEAEKRFASRDWRRHRVLADLDRLGVRFNLLGHDMADLAARLLKTKRAAVEKFITNPLNREAITAFKPGFATVNGFIKAKSRRGVASSAAWFRDDAAVSLVEAQGFDVERAAKLDGGVEAA